MILKRILLPTDASQESEESLEYAVSLARDNHAELDILHIEPKFVPMAGYMPYVVPGEDEGETLARVQEKIPVPHDVVSHYYMTNGGVVEEIIYFARQNPIDLIVIGTHGREGWQRLIRGSLAAEIIRHAPCPVLSVRYGRHPPVN